MTYMDPFPKGTRVSQREFTNPGGFNPSGGHTGRDYAVPVGTPIRAAHDGIIRASSWFTSNYKANPWWLTNFGGDTLVLDCTDAFGRSDTMPTFVYAHCSSSIAEVGQRVKKGQIIGLSGNSGTATSGPHCHVERLNPGYDLTNNVYGRSALNFDEYFLESNGIAAMGEAKATPTPMPVQEKDEDDMLYITKAKGDSVIWIGNMITRRPVNDVAELQVLRQFAKTGVVKIFRNGDTQDWPPAYIGVPVVEVKK